MAKKKKKKTKRVRKPEPDGSQTALAAFEKIIGGKLVEEQKPWRRN